MTAPAAASFRRSLSWRLLWLTIAIMAMIEVLIFVPAMERARDAWLADRLIASQIAITTVPPVDLPPNLGPVPNGGGARMPDRVTREQLLRLAGVVSIRIQEPGRPMAVLAGIGQPLAPTLLDLRRETTLSRLRNTAAALLDRDDELLLVVAQSPAKPSATLSVVLHRAELDAALHAAARLSLLQSLAVVAATGIAMLVSLHILLVRPMRRITDSIISFRADPERSGPFDADAVAANGSDEIGAAAHELAAMQRELRAALWRNARLAAVGTAVAKVSHDLRGILSPAMLTAERLQGHADDKVRRAGDVLMRSVERATELVRRTLDIAREIPPTATREALSVRRLIDEAAEQVRADRPAVAVENDIDDSVMVQADGTEMARVFANLLRNAAEAGADHIVARAAGAFDAVTITVADNGPGLPEPVRAHLFQPFVSGGKRGGTGLGLAIVRDLVRAYGGDVELVRTGADGTEFCLILPAPPGARAAPVPVAAGARPGI
jgi:signal transduction histidine kinase